MFEKENSLSGLPWHLEEPFSVSGPLGTARKSILVAEKRIRDWCIIEAIHFFSGDHTSDGTDAINRPGS